MRKFLMASAATLGAVGMAGLAAAQTPAPAPAVPVSPLEGSVITTAAPAAGANNNNNYQGGPAIPGSRAIPTPGTFVIHLNGALVVEATLQQSSFTTYLQGGTYVSNGTGTTAFATAPGWYKQNPQSFQSYFRLYPGVDAMATNGLRYGASVELRENWASTTITGGNQNSTSASGESSTQTMFVRRAFVYAATDQLGIIRFGQGDGVLGIFDNGVTSAQQVSPSGGMNGSDVQTPLPGNSYMGFPFYAQNGIEYANQKLVYLSPQFFGFDLGLEYAPSNSNAEVSGGICTNGTTADPKALGALGVNATDCTTLSSSPLPSDAARYTNQYEAGLRYQGVWGPVSILAHVSYLGSGIVDYTGTVANAGAAAGSPWNGKYDVLSVVQGGAAVTFAGFTVAALANHGQMNNNTQGNPMPSGAPDQNAYIVSIFYTNGPWNAGFAYEQADSQGAPAMTGLTQRHEWGLNPGVAYTIAPGFVGFAEYFYGQRHQGDWNFATGAQGTAYNDVRAQSFLLGTRVYW